MSGIPSMASDAGPDERGEPMDLDDWMFEAVWESQAADRAFQPAAKLRHIAAAERALAKARELVEAM